MNFNIISVDYYYIREMYRWERNQTNALESRYLNLLLKKVLFFIMIKIQCLYF